MLRMCVAWCIGMHQSQLRVCTRNADELGAMESLRSAQYYTTLARLDVRHTLLGVNF